MSSKYKTIDNNKRKKNNKKKERDTNIRIHTHTYKQTYITYMFVRVLSNKYFRIFIRCPLIKKHRNKK